MGGREETREGEWASKLIKLLWIKNSVWECNYGEMPDAVSFPTESRRAGAGTGIDGWKAWRKNNKTNNDTRAAEESFMMRVCIFFFIFIYEILCSHEALISSISCKKNKIRAGSLISISKGGARLHMCEWEGKMMIFFSLPLRMA